MRRHSRIRRIVTAAVLPLAVAGLGLTLVRPGAAATTALPAAATPDRTNPAEAHLVDQVPTPVLHWTPCQRTDECAAAALPLDYHDPHGPTVDVALLRVPAKDPSHRIGTLFVNPGGPGDSATAFAALVPQAVPEDMLDQFDIVGIDPRGVGSSQQIRCFDTTAKQTLVEGPLTDIPFPTTPAQQRTWVSDAKALGRDCATTAGQLASAMSATEDARDMDVLRRAVGDSKLTYAGFSFGSYLGELYANMFPDRVRAIALDGIIDPRTYVGTPATANVPVFVRIGSAAASDSTLHELLVRCQQAGRSRCSFADADTPARFDQLAAQIEAHPLRRAAPGVPTTTYTYANLVQNTELWMHDPDGYVGLFADLSDLTKLTAPDRGGADHDALVRDILSRHPVTPPAPGYDNHLEAQSAIACTDGLHGTDAALWPAAAAAADRAGPYFGAYYAWVSVECARNTWTAQDPDVYCGPFNHRTVAPVLVVGALWDPATSYDNAVNVAALLPNSRLVSSDSWGHEALTTSACVDNSFYDYLLDPQALAPKTTYCRGDVQPFAPTPAATH